MDDLIEDIINYCNDHSCAYSNISLDSSITKIHNLICKDIFAEPVNIDEYIYYGKYYEVKIDYENMKKYYFMAIEKDNSTAMNNLGYRYYKLGDYDNGLKYMLMAIEKGHVIAMNNLGYFYQMKGDYNKMKKYYKMAIREGNSTAMFNLGFYHGKYSYYKMKKYFFMAIEKGNVNAMNHLADYYYRHHDYDNMMKYYLMAIEKEDFVAMDKLSYYYENKDDYYNLVMLHYNNRFTIGKEEHIIKYFEIFLRNKEIKPFDNDMLKVIKDIKECYELAKDWANNKNNIEIFYQVFYYVHNDYYKILLLLRNDIEGINKMSYELLNNIMYQMN